MKLKLIDFINTNPDWRNLLSGAPYFINISDDEMFGRKLVMFKYNQIDSDFSLDLVKECRGLILDMTDGVIPFSVPYFKFFNAGESHAAEIDWTSAVVSAKIDGSLIKVVKYNDELLISTNGVIDAYKCNLPSQINCPFQNFGQLFEDAVRNQHLECGYNGVLEDAMKWFKDLIEPGNTYMFELCSRWNRIVVPHDQSRLYFHGLRDNKTMLELPFEICSISEFFMCPEFYRLMSLDACIKASQQLPWDDEGYVVRDKNFNRVKIKSPEYVKIHKMANNGNLSMRRAVDVFMENEIDELLAYFPEYNQVFVDIKNKYIARENELNELYGKLKSLNLGSRKEQALWILANTKCSGLMFEMLKGDLPAKDCLEKLYHKNKDSFVEALGLYD